MVGDHCIGDGVKGFSLCNKPVFVVHLDKLNLSKHLICVHGMAPIFLFNRGGINCLTAGGIHDTDEQDNDCNEG